MKKISLLMLLLLSSYAYGLQDERLDEFPFDDEPLREESLPYFAIGGGLIGNFNFINLKDLNSAFVDKNIETSELKTPLFMLGGTFFTGIPWVKNLRVGIFWSSGSTLSDEFVVNPESGNNLLRQSEYNATMTGFSFDYGFVLTKSLAFLPGISMGWGQNSVEIFQSPNAVNWNEVGVGQPNNANYTRLDKSFLFIQPNLYLDYALSPFLMVRLNAGYNLTFDNFLANSSNWRINRLADVSGVPNSIRPDGAFVQLGVCVGLFNY